MKRIEIPPAPFKKGEQNSSSPQFAVLTSFDIPLRGMKAMVKYHRLRMTEREGNERLKASIFEASF